MTEKVKILFLYSGEYSMHIIVAESGDPPSMLNILGLVRKPSTDESSLDRAPSDSEGLPDSKTEQLQAAEISEPPKHENGEVLSSELTGKCKLKGTVLTQSSVVYFVNVLLEPKAYTV
jgi:hypothetical protein